MDEHKTQEHQTRENFHPEDTLVHIPSVQNYDERNGRPYKRMKRFHQNQLLSPLRIVVPDFARLGVQGATRIQ